MVYLIQVDLRVVFLCSNYPVSSDQCYGYRTLHLNSTDHLRLINERFALALKESAITVWQQDLDLLFTWVYNPVSRVDVSTIIGKSDSDLVERAEDAEAIVAVKRSVIETGCSRHEVIPVQEKGETRYYDLRVDPTLSESGNITGITCVSIDITQHKRVAVALRESEERFRSLLEDANSSQQELLKTADRLSSVLDTSLDCIYRFNLQAQDYDYFSPASVNVLGHTPEQLMAMDMPTVLSLVHPEDRIILKSAIDRLPETGHEEFEYRRIVENRGYRWFAHQLYLVKDNEGRPLYRCGSIRDCTERKDEQQEIQRLAGIVELSKDFIGVFGLDGSTMYVNEAGRQMVGLLSDQTLNTSVVDFLFPEDLPDLLAFIDGVKATGSGSTETRFRHFVTGEQVDVHHLVVLIRDPVTNQPTALATVTRDIREQKRIEAERAEIAAKREKISETVQRSLLLSPPHDGYPGILTQPFYQSAYDDALVGGDFYDIFPVTKDLIALIVGDGTGKGISAATYTAEVKFVLRGYLREFKDDLASAISRLNAFILDNMRLDVLHSHNCCVALTAALVDMSAGEVLCTCAGAEPPLIQRSCSGDVVSGCDY